MGETDYNALLYDKMKAEQDIFSKRFIICHSFSQKFQTLICYLCPIKMGKLMSKMTVRYVNDKKG